MKAHCGFFFLFFSFVLFLFTHVYADDCRMIECGPV